MSEAIEISYTGGLQCKTRFPSTGQTFETDVPRAVGGQGTAFSATDLVAAALGVCTVTMLAAVAGRHSLDVSGMTARVEKEMTTTPVRRIGKIRVVVTMPKGLRLSSDDRALLQKAAEHCPVKQSLHPEIDLDVQLAYPE
jgi:putative redox protein